MFSESEIQSNQYHIDLNYNSLKVNKKYVGTDKIVYKIFNYDKKYVCINDTELAKYRSVVIAEKGLTTSTKHFNQELLCFSPPKSMEFDLFEQLYPANGDFSEELCINEIIEGTMINLFYDSRNLTWELCTKSAIGANYQFYQYNILEDQYDPKTKIPLTFRDMFMEALDVPHYTDINKIPFVTNLPKNFSYSFVLQHHQNHIVLPIKHAKLYLVAVYKIVNDCTSFAEYIPLTTVKNCTYMNNTHIHFPREFLELKHKTYEEIKNEYCSGFSDPSLLGFMITHYKTGDRMSIRNIRYEYIKEIRGNYSHIQYLYLNLLRTGKLMEFLELFPFYKNIFHIHYVLYKTYVAAVHNAYMEVYVNKNKHIPLDLNIKYLIQKIQNEVFIPSLRDTQTGRITITRRFVWRYLLDEVYPSMVMYYMVKVPSFY